MVAVVVDGVGPDQPAPLEVFLFSPTDVVPSYTIRVVIFAGGLPSIKVPYSVCSEVITMVSKIVHPFCRILVAEKAFRGLIRHRCVVGQ
jgi:hypothetical protein